VVFKDDFIVIVEGGVFVVTIVVDSQIETHVEEHISRLQVHFFFSGWQSIDLLQKYKFRECLQNSWMNLRAN
jgi:hypothetical protein